MTGEVSPARQRRCVPPAPVNRFFDLGNATARAAATSPGA
jgi:hypothetical protein